MTLRWENPPPRSNRFGPVTRWDTVASELKRNPGRWAVIREKKNPTEAEKANLSNLTSRINRAGLAAFAPRGAFMAVSRTVGDTHKVYAVYVGEE